MAEQGMATAEHGRDTSVAGLRIQTADGSAAAAARTKNAINYNLCLCCRRGQQCDGFCGVGVLVVT